MTVTAMGAVTSTVATSGVALINTGAVVVVVVITLTVVMDPVGMIVGTVGVGGSRTNSIC